MRQTLTMVLLAALLAGCGRLVEPPCADGYQPSDWTHLTQETDLAQARWDAAGLRSYVYTMEWSSAHVLPPERVTVQGDVVTSVQRLPTLEPRPVRSGQTVSDLFASVRSWISRGGAGTTSCLSLRVEYDETLGYPTSIGMSNHTRRLADADGGWTMSEFTPLAP